MNNKITKTASRMTVMMLILCFAFIKSVSAGPAEDETCLDCHDGIDKALEFTAHSVTGNNTKPVSCIDCHSGWEKHVDDPSADNITIPSDLSGEDEYSLCSSCHVPHSELDNYGYDSHNLTQMSCSSCHKIHGGTEKLLIDRQDEFCLNCHGEVKSQFSARSAHPIKNGSVTCLSCHEFSHKVDDNYSYGMMSVCVDCHGEQTGPFVHEHGAAISFAAGDKGCEECHNPHGSVNDRLLIQPANQLCQNCHFVPLHKTAHAGVYSKMDCTTCHTEIHGSMESSFMFDPNLGSKFNRDCFQSGCHSMND